MVSAHAVIVAGTDGEGNNNNTQSGLDDYLETNSYSPFPYWNNLVRFSNASGVYLGYNPSTLRGWILSAQHINPRPTTVKVAGNTYTVTGTGTQIGSSDLRLFEIGGGISDPTLPALPAVLLPDEAADLGEFLLMFGRGFTNSSTSPYPWVDPSTNDANGMRWGTNTVEDTGLVDIDPSAGVNLQPYIITDFDAAGDDGATDYDAQGAVGDSGGGMFILRDGQWQLSGIAHFVVDGTTEGGSGNPSRPGDLTGYSDVFSHLATIQGITGTLIPEPSVISLIALAALPLLRRRRS